MLDTIYLNEVQQKLTDYFKNNIDHHDDHHVSVYPSLQGDDGYITYTPNWLDNHNDNDGQIMPIRHVIVKAISNKGQWAILVNQQFIHAQKFTEHDYDLNLNYRHDNGISKKGAKKLAKDLKTKFNVHLSETGLLVSKVDVKNKKAKNLTLAFANMVKAVQFVNNNGFNYTDSQGNPNAHQTSSKTSNKQADEDVSKTFANIKKADHAYHVEKRKHAGKARKPKKKRAPGQIKKAYSSTNGTPWQRDNEIRAAKKKKLSRANKNKKTTKSKKPTKASVIISGHNFATCGRFKSSTPAVKKFITNHGGKVESTVSSKTNYLVCNKPSKSKKYQKAEQASNVHIISESDLKNAKK